MVKWLSENQAGKVMAVESDGGDDGGEQQVTRASSCPSTLPSSVLWVDALQP